MQREIQQHRNVTPPGIIGSPLSDFATAKIMVGCECCGRTFIPVRGLLKKYGTRSIGDVIDTFRCARCGQPPSTACLLSQTHLI